MNNYYLTIKQEEKKIILDLFKPFISMVEMSGGDGDGTIYCKYFNYLDIANLFDQYLKDLSKTIKYIRRDNLEMKEIYFGCGQQGICIKQMPIPTHENIPYQTVVVGFNDITIVI